VHPLHNEALLLSTAASVAARALRARAVFCRIVRLVEESPPPVLLRPGHFAWTGRNPLATYLGANSASHYRFATKVLTR